MNNIKNIEFYIKNNEVKKFQLDAGNTAVLIEDHRILCINDGSIYLSPTEFIVLKMLIRNYPFFVPSERFDHHFSSDGSRRVTICEMRKKLKPLGYTIYGQRCNGYKFSQYRLDELVTESV